MDRQPINTFFVTAMSCITCPQCKLVNWMTEAFCKRCSYQFDPNASQPTYDHYQTASQNQQYEYGNAHGPQRGGADHRTFGQQGMIKTGLAIASMVIGIISLPASFLLIGLLLAPIALMLGIVAIAKAARRPLEYGGKGFAIAGIATSSTALLLIVPIIAAIAIPNILAAKRAADEGAAIRDLRVLFAAQSTYISTAGAGRCGDLRSLGTSRLIDGELANGTKNGYRFESNPSSTGIGCDVYATPVKRTDNMHSFMIVGSEGAVRGARKKGSRAEASDPRLDQPN